MSQEELPLTRAVATVEKIDNGKPALYNPAAFDQIWRAARLFASSDLVPKDYKDKPENCFIAIEMADRLGINPFAVLQSLVILQGKPSMEAKLITALVNDSGMFVDPLEYEVVGDDPFALDYKVRAFATMARTGKVCLGPWIDYRMVKGEGWLDKGGSKWKTMPSIMFMYRAASFFAKVYCSNITMGMQTREEMEDSREPVDVTPRQQNLASTRQVEQIERAAATVQTQQQPDPDKPLFEGVTDAGAHQVQPPTRKRGEPREGAKRRNSAEVAEDAAADLADQQAAELAQNLAMETSTANTTVDPACDCPDEALFTENGILMCGKCGCAVPEESPEPETATPAQQAAQTAKQQGGAEPDLF